MCFIIHSICDISGYKSLVERICSTNALNLTKEAEIAATTSGKPFNKKAPCPPIKKIPADWMSPGDPNAPVCGVLRTVIFGGPWLLRQALMQRFFVKHFPMYADTCCAPFPPKRLTLASYQGDASVETLGLNVKSYAENRLDEDEGAPTDEVALKRTEARLGSKPKTNELYMTWYQPVLDQCFMSSGASTSRHIALLYAIVTTSGNESKCQLKWIPANKLLAIHKW